MPKIKRQQEQSTFCIYPWKHKSDTNLSLERREVSSGATAQTDPQIGARAGSRTFSSKALSAPHAGSVKLGADDSSRHRQCILQKYADTLTTSGQPTKRASACLPGFVVIFPDGRIEGRTWTQQKGKHQLTITGTQLSAGRDCMRDNDWQVYSLHIADADNLPLRLLASKTGGDAAHIHAPFDMHSSEEEDYFQYLTGCSKIARLSFQCAVIKESDSRVEALLSQSGLHHLQGATINLGDYVWDREYPTASKVKVDNKLTAYDSDLDG